jgi:hypothetical protein
LTSFDEVILNEMFSLKIHIFLHLANFDVPKAKNDTQAIYLEVTSRNMMPTLWVLRRKTAN